MRLVFLLSLQSTILLVATGCVESAPSHQRWLMTFCRGENNSAKALVDTIEVFDRKPLILRSYNGPVSCANDGKTEGQLNGNGAAGTLISVGPRCGGAFTVRDKASGKLLGIIKTGHSYSFMMGLSPCGEYVLYQVPGEFGSSGKIILHHWPTGRQARLDLPGTWRLLEWTAEFERRSPE